METRYGVSMHGDTDSATGNRIPVDGKLAYSPKSAAEVLDLGERTIWGLIEDGLLKSFKVGRSRRISRAELEAFVQRQQAAA